MRGRTLLKIRPQRLVGPKEGNLLPGSLFRSVFRPIPIIRESLHSAQGDESITSADISSDGKRLAIATMAGIRVFGLRLESGMLNVRKLEKIQTCADLSKRQAKVIRFSPDTKWLATIGGDNIIRMYRRSEGPKDKMFYDYLDESAELKRLRRDTSNTKARDACLGSYNRSINRLEFSADSRILAVSDISGFLDTWVIEGQEDLTQNDEVSYPLDATDKSDSSDEEDSDQEDSRTTFFGERWIRNPAASLLAKLPATPLVLAFRPSTPQAQSTITNGSIGVHSTRHNPHPHSHDLPHGEDRLLIVTAENQIYEFNILSGKISDWSRRNPTSSLPQEFRDLRDRAKSAVWDHTGRVWLYGISWLWMFDLSRDLPAVGDEQKQGITTNGISKEISLKRKREDNDEQSTASRPRIDTGAGSKISYAERGTNIGRNIREINGADAMSGRWINLDAEQDGSSDEESDHVLANETQQALAKLRRSDTNTNAHIPNGESTDAEGPKNDDTPTPTAKTKRGKRLSYWHTYKYRPILGIVPLGDETDDEGVTGDRVDEAPLGLEVALVERPLFDAELPPRYLGSQEWDP